MKFILSLSIRVRLDIFISTAKRYESEILQLTSKLDKAEKSMESNAKSNENIKQDIKQIKKRFELLVENMQLQLKMDEVDEKDK